MAKFNEYIVDGNIYSSAYTISRIVQLLNNPLGRAVIAFDDKSLLKEAM